MLPTPPPSSSAIASTAPIDLRFTVAAEGADGVDLDFFPAGGELFILSDAPQGSFVIAEPSGLRPLPELTRGARSTAHTVKVERLVGSWPGSLWLQTLDVEQDVRPADPPWTSRLFRNDGGGWMSVGDTKSDAIYWAAWTSTPRCLVGVRGTNKVAHNERRVADCPGGSIPVRPLSDPSGTWVVREGAASPEGDAVLFEESYDRSRDYRLEVISAADPPVISAYPLPLPDTVRAGTVELRIGDHGLLVRSSTDIYVRGELRGKPDAQNHADREPVLLHFDGARIARIEAPHLLGSPVLAVTKDGTLVLAVAGRDDEIDDFTVWERRPGRAWNKVAAYHAPPGQGRWHIYDIWARSSDDVWIACARRGSKQRRVLRSLPVREVWRPRR